VERSQRPAPQDQQFPRVYRPRLPAPCEAACVAGLIDDPITIKNNEYAIVDRAWEEGWIVPRIPRRNGLKVAVVGSGPAGLAAADQLNQKGYTVTVYEREDRIGGLLMYGIPNMKLEKKTVDRRVDLLREEGVEFVTNADVGATHSVQQLQNENDAVVLCIGSTVPRDVGDVPGRHLKGIHYAMEFLTKNQKRLLLTVDGKLQSGWDRNFVTAEGKDVVVIGGGDTGTDCIATAMRHRCKSVVNLEINLMPPPTRAPENPWPEYPRIYGVDYGHAESRAVFDRDPREYGRLTRGFKGNDAGEVTHVITQQVVKNRQTGEVTPVEDSEEIFPADLVLFSMGFSHPEQAIASQLGLDVDQRRNIRAEYGHYTTSVEGVFAAGDCRRGQSLVVWAIHEGRGVADAVEKYFLNEGFQPEVDHNQRYG
jgi:glutamate synthase (NADPH) small chain